MRRDDGILLVDPLVPGMTEALAPLLANPGVLKVMHSASEDLVAFKHACGVLPVPLFDTQVAAALAGIGGGMGYQKLVQAQTGISVDKGETRSDWLRRPLSPAQLQYAADDVRHLHLLHRQLDDRLASLGRDAWLAEDCTRLLAGVADDEGERWPHLPLRSAQFLDRHAQVRVLRLLRWRDVHARRSDRPRSWILDNELAVTIARQNPADAQTLRSLLEATPKSPRNLCDALFAGVDDPACPTRRMRHWHAATTATRNSCVRCRMLWPRSLQSLACPMGCLPRANGWKPCRTARIGLVPCQGGGARCWNRRLASILAAAPLHFHLMRCLAQPRQ